MARLSDTKAVRAIGVDQPDYVSIQKIDGGFKICRSGGTGGYTEQFTKNRPSIHVEETPGNLVGEEGLTGAKAEMSRP